MGGRRRPKTLKKNLPGSTLGGGEKQTTRIKLEKGCEKYQRSNAPRAIRAGESDGEHVEGHKLEQTKMATPNRRGFPSEKKSNVEKKTGRGEGRGGSNLMSKTKAKKKHVTPGRADNRGGGGKGH